MLAFFAVISVIAQSLLTNEPVWITSDFFRAGNQYVISQLTGSSSTPTYTFAFSSALSGVPLLGYGIKAYEGSDYFGQQRFQINRTALTAATYSVVVQIVGVTNIWTLNVAYIAIDPLFPHQMNSFDNVPLNYQAGSLVNITTKQPIYRQYTNTINFTKQSVGLPFNKFAEPYDQNIILLFMTSIYIQAILESDQNNVSLYLPLDIFIDADVVSESEYYMSVQFGIEALIQKLHFSQIIFNQKDVQSSLKYVLVYDKFDIDQTGHFIPVPEQFVDNFILGLTDFSSELHKSVLDFKWNFDRIDGVFGIFIEEFIADTNGNPGGQKVLNRTGLTMLYIKTWYCPNDTSYFNQLTQLCTECPVPNCNICSSLTECHQCDWQNQYHLHPNTSQCIRCEIDDGQCFDESTFQCFECVNYTGAAISSSGTFSFIIQVEGNVTAEDIKKYGKFTNSQITSFVVYPTNEPGVFRIQAKYKGDLSKPFSTHFILSNTHQTFHILYTPILISDPDSDSQRVVLIPEKEDMSIFIAIGTTLALLACCCVSCIAGIRRYKRKEKKEKKRDKSINKNKQKPQQKYCGNNKIANLYEQQKTEQNLEGIIPMDTTIHFEDQSNNLLERKKYKKHKKQKKKKIAK